MGNWDEYTDRYHPEHGNYDGFELSVNQQKRIDIISQQCSVGYPDEETCREDTDWLENTLQEVTAVLRNEQEYGYENVTLKHDLSKMRKLLDKLSQELGRLDP